MKFEKGQKIKIPDERAFLAITKFKTVNEDQIFPNTADFLYLKEMSVFLGQTLEISNVLNDMVGTGLNICSHNVYIN